MRVVPSAVGNAASFLLSFLGLLSSSFLSHAAGQPSDHCHHTHGVYDLSQVPCGDARSGYIAGCPDLWYACETKSCKVTSKEEKVPGLRKSGAGGGRGLALGAIVVSRRLRISRRKAWGKIHSREINIDQLHSNMTHMDLLTTNYYRYK